MGVVRAGATIGERSIRTGLKLGLELRRLLEEALQGSLRNGARSGLELRKLVEGTLHGSQILGLELRRLLGIEGTLLTVRGGSKMAGVQGEGCGEGLGLLESPWRLNGGGEWCITASTWGPEKK